MIPIRDHSESATEVDPRTHEARQKSGPGCSATGGDSHDTEESPPGSVAAREEEIDEAIEMTFPASDPPAWMSSGSRGAVPGAMDTTVPPADAK
jgi:hypothetical protein